MPFTVTREGAAPAIIGVQAVFDMLMPDTDVPELLFRLKRREQVRVMFNDGTWGNIAPLEGVVEPDPPGPIQLHLPTPILLRDFEIECALSFEIEAIVRCRAPDRATAAQIVQQVLSGARPADASFEIDVDREALLQTFTNLDEAIGGNDVDELSNAIHVKINNISETIIPFEDRP